LYEARRRLEQSEAVSAVEKEDENEWLRLMDDADENKWLSLMDETGEVDIMVEIVQV